MPAKYDIDVWKGNSAAIPLRFKTITVVDGVETEGPLVLTGSKLIFLAVWPSSGTLRKETGVSSTFTVTDAAQGEALLRFTFAETRVFPDAPAEIKYEIELWAGTEQTSLLYGNIKVSGWINDDAS